MRVSILGTRGIPARHGGFETFAEHLALHLVERGHEVTVYCQDDADRQTRLSVWRGIRLVHLFGGEGALGTMAFDLRSVRHALASGTTILTLGYNTAIFSVLYRLKSIPSLMNMDGIEWKREKWSFPLRTWLRFNEWAGARLSNHLIADHPEIARHLEALAKPEKITVIPYGADAIHWADANRLHAYSLQPGSFGLVIARPEPENSILEIVQAYSRRPRGMPLVILGHFKPETNAYHKSVLDSASDEVVFPGAIYEAETVRALRFYARVYFHGHRVGGTNPSLVEALAAGNPIVAHDNRFTRWVAGSGARFFHGADDLAALLDHLLENTGLLASMAKDSRERHAAEFTQERILRQYEMMLHRFAPGSAPQSVHVAEPVAMKKAG